MTDQVVTQNVVTQNVAALYAGPDTSAEMVSQAICGERVTVREEQDGFCRVTTEDRYAGWIDARFLTPQSDFGDLLSTTIATLFADVYTYPDARSEIQTKLTAGTRIAVDRAGTDDWAAVHLPGGIQGFVHTVSLSRTHDADNFQTAQESGLGRGDIISALGIVAAETAKRLAGTPYLWGGTTPFGIDCSGLIQLAYKLSGIQLLRDAHLQCADRRFGRVEEEQSLETAILETGDLVAFSRRDDKRPTHIGIALGDGRFLHSRGGLGVRIDFCDTPEYLATYLGAFRLASDADFAVQSA